MANSCVAALVFSCGRTIPVRLCLLWGLGRPPPHSREGRMPRPAQTRDGGRRAAFLNFNLDEEQGAHFWTNLCFSSTVQGVSASQASRCCHSLPTPPSPQAPTPHQRELAFSLPGPTANQLSRASKELTTSLQEEIRRAGQKWRVREDSTQEPQVAGEEKRGAVGDAKPFVLSSPSPALPACPSAEKKNKSKELLQAPCRSRAIWLIFRKTQGCFRADL